MDFIRIAKFARALFTAPDDLKDAYREAELRDKAAGAELDAKDPGWRESGMVFDGPGSHPSLFAHLEDVLRERGLLEKARSHFGV